jgi:glycosyl transferase family 25
MFKTFVINLDKDIERMHFMHKQLTELDISYERQPAIYGNSYIHSGGELNKNSNLLPNELGCALSHAEVYKKIVAGNIPYALVFEDDVALPQNFKKIILQMVDEQKKSGFEYLLFDYIPVGKPFIKHWLQSAYAHIKSRFQTTIVGAFFAIVYAVIKSFYIIPLSLFEGWREKYMNHKPGPVRFFRPIYFAGAYLVTLEGAKKLLSLAQPVIYTADQLPNKARVMKRLRFFVFSPLVVYQKRKTFGSSILGLSGEEMSKIYQNNINIR